MYFLTPSCIVITGASSGIGAALARAYAKKGVRLGLMGKNMPRLSDIAAFCESQGADVEIGLIDVTDMDAMQKWLGKFDDKQRVDLIIANAGISAGTGGGGESEQQVRDIFTVNLGGVLNTVLPLLPRMQRRRHGQIALMSSLAGLRGLPSCPAYSASKMAVRAFGEALRGSLHNDNVGVSVICPGYVRTPMTMLNRFFMPFLMDSDKAAQIIIRALGKNRARIAFPLRLYLPFWLLACLPVWLTDPLFAALPRKEAMAHP